MATTIPPLESKYVKAKISDLNEAMRCAEKETDRQEEILRHIKAVENDPKFQLNPEFPDGLEWLNTTGALSFEMELKGKLVVLDFFTYCCINCMHILPDLRDLERKYSDMDGMVVVGVHSAKFKNEKLLENICNAVERYDITHPVVNDQDIVLWERLGIVCWPTLVIIGPNCQLLHYIIGEGHGAELASFVDVAMDYYGNKLSRDPIRRPVSSGKSKDSILKYPGKLCGDEAGKHLFISDTAHHRAIVVSQSTGEQGWCGPACTLLAALFFLIGNVCHTYSMHECRHACITVMYIVK